MNSYVAQKASQAINALAKNKQMAGPRNSETTHQVLYATGKEARMSILSKKGGNSCATCNVLGVLLIITGCLFGSGCSTTQKTFKAYQGSDLRPEELATLCEIPKPPTLSAERIFMVSLTRSSYTEVHAIDGVPVASPSGRGICKSVQAFYELTPGKHVVSVSAHLIKNTGAIGALLQPKPHDLIFTALAGHKYRVNYNQPVLGVTKCFVDDLSTGETVSEIAK